MNKVIYSHCKNYFNISDDRANYYYYDYYGDLLITSDTKLYMLCSGCKEHCNFNYNNNNYYTYYYFVFIEKKKALSLLKAQMLK